MNSPLEIQIEEDLRNLCKSLCFGTLKTPPQKVPGGALHTMWELNTSQGSYMVKRINADSRSKPTFPKRFEETEALALHLQQHGVPSVPALSVDDHFVQEGIFLVYPRIDGRVLEANEVNEKHAAKIGKACAAIHLSPPPTEGYLKKKFDSYPREHWEDLVGRWNSEQAKKLLPQFIYWSEKFKEAIPILEEQLCMTHCDLHRGNVLWDEADNCYLIDWERGGHLNPLMEVLGFGFEWADLFKALKPELLRSLLKGYFDQVPENHSLRKIGKSEVEAAYYGWLGHCVLEWTEYNFRRALGGPNIEKFDQERGKEFLEERLLPVLNVVKDKERDALELAQKLITNYLMFGD